MPPCFRFIVLGLFDFSLLRTHFCLINEYSVEFRAALRGKVGGIRGEIVELADRKRRRSTATLHEDTAYCTLIARDRVPE
jgi:hypothetical protein